MNINELIEKAHDLVKRKGFWDAERNTGELLMLIVSECGEALEAHRKGKRADPNSRPYNIETTDDQDEWFRKHIKDTFEDELADIVIRIADWMGANNWKYSEGVQTVYVPWSPNVGEMLWHLVIILVGGESGSAATEAPNCSQALDHAFKIAAGHNIDLWRHIELKMAYNESRPRLHGKAY